MIYVVVQDGDGAESVFTGFRPCGHALLAEKFCERGARVVGAGFCRFDGHGGVEVWGGSEGLGIKARVEDARIIADAAWVTLGTAPVLGTCAARWIVGRASGSGGDKL